jgi:3-hydroxyisobutyrate dehydrogenase-like beta-hydroxyacid dehydrogenase
MTIGFIGLGRMGGPMCRNLIAKCGEEVVVFDLDPAKVEACTQLGAAAAASLEQLAGAVDVVFSSLPMPQDVEVAAGAIANHARAGTTYFDLTTSSPQLARRLAAELETCGIAMLDIPVSGGPAGAEAGTLAVMAGGDEAVFEAHRPLIECFAATAIHVGPVGSGLVAKLINNMLGISAVAAACEGLMLGVQAGLDAERLDAVIRASTGDSLAYRALADRALSGDYTPAFALDLAYKDVHLALELADQLAVPTPIGASTHNLMRMARGLGLGDADPTAMIRVYETTLGREVRDSVSALETPPR